MNSINSLLSSELFIGVVRIVQLLGGMLSLFVFVKLHQIEKKYIFKGRSEDLPKEIQAVTDLLLAFAKHKPPQGENFYAAVALAESTLTTISRVAPATIGNELKACKQALDRLRAPRKYVFFKAGWVTPNKEAQSSAWELLGSLHALSRAIVNVSKEHAWRK